MEHALSNRVAIVTGASAGIGQATAMALAAAGASVVVNARREARLAALVAEIEAAGGSAVAVAGDAVEPAVVNAMLEAPQKAWSRVADLIVVNAGRGLHGSPLTSDESEWEEVIRINLLGAMRLIRHGATRMRDTMPTPDDWRTNPRDIVVISSSVGKNVSPFSSMYGSTKFAITSVAEAVRRELAPTGIRVSAIHPAVVRSEFQQVAGYDADQFGSFMEQIGPVLEPEDIARLIVFTTSQPAHVALNDIMIRPTRQEYP